MYNKIFNIVILIVMVCCRKSHGVACEDDAEAEKDKIRLKPIFEHPKSHCSKKKFDDNQNYDNNLLTRRLEPDCKIPKSLTTSDSLSLAVLEGAFSSSS